MRYVVECDCGGVLFDLPLPDGGGFVINAPLKCPKCGECEQVAVHANND
jgi:hypothetical protein